MSQANSHDSIQEIERGIEKDRSHFAETLNALENKFSPGQLVDQALSYAKRNGGDFSDNLVKTISNNPIPTILTGIGVAWMALNQNRNEVHRSDGAGGSDYEPGRYYETGSYTSSSDSKLAGAKEQASGMKDRTKATASGLKNQVSDSAHRARQKAHHMKEQARHSAAGMGERSRQQWEQTSSSARHFFSENPLAVGAAAVAIGALIGASLPVSSREKEMLGDTGEKTLDKAKSVASEAKHRATEAGKAGVQAAKETARNPNTSASSV